MAVQSESTLCQPASIHRARGNGRKRFVRDLAALLGSSAKSPVRSTLFVSKKFLHVTRKNSCRSRLVCDGFAVAGRENAFRARPLATRFLASARGDLQSVSRQSGSAKQTRPKVVTERRCAVIAIFEGPVATKFGGGKWSHFLILNTRWPEGDSRRLGSSLGTPENTRHLADQIGARFFAAGEWEESKNCKICAGIGWRKINYSGTKFKDEYWPCVDCNPSSGPIKEKQFCEFSERFARISPALLAELCESEVQS